LLLRFLRRNAIFILFPAVVVAIVFLARISFTTAERFGEWGERSIVESTWVVAKEKVERVEQIISTTDHSFFNVVDPAHVSLACERWQGLIRISRLIEAAAIIYEDEQIAAFFYRDESLERGGALYALMRDEVLPLLDKYESMDQHKHLHRPIAGKQRLITSLTTEYEGQDYTAVLLYDTDEVTGNLFGSRLGDAGPDRLINVVDNNNRILFGERMDEAGEFIVSLRFPSTFYKWRVQLAPRSAALFTERSRTQRFSQAMLIPLAFAVIVFGLVVLYMAMVRERRLNRLKSEFIANVSHELKTPLSLIRMFGELLSMGRITDEQKTKRYHEIILRETERLTALIDKVLDFAKIERGKSAYEFQETDLTELVERAVDIYRHRIDEAGARLECKVEEGLPPLMIDPHAITLALINLIDNAVKYASGTDVIGVEVGRRDSEVSLDVYDRGVGIPAPYLKRVFDRFYRYQRDGEGSGSQRGSGIGLSLVRHIAEAHGGSVIVTSTPGVETRFSVKIPLQGRS
jgi:two-component system phosphate regulon sensor histidine kinase PhoR